MAPRYPFDPSDYSRGDMIPPDHIEHAYGVKREDRDAYKLCQMRFRNVLDDHFNGVVSIRCTGDGLYILPPDQEGIDYIRDSWAKAGRAIAKRLLESTSIDRSLVPPSEMKEFTEQVARISWISTRLKDKKWLPPPPPDEEG